MYIVKGISKHAFNNTHFTLCNSIFAFHITSPLPVGKIWAHISPTGRGEEMGNSMIIVKKKLVVQNQEKNEYLS